MEADRILVVDDDARIRQMLVRYFEDNGYRVSAVGNGAAMRSELAKGSYAAIFLDLVLPNGENGLELLKELRATSDVPVLMLTGQDDVTDKVVGQTYVATDFGVPGKTVVVAPSDDPTAQGDSDADDDSSGGPLVAPVPYPRPSWR